MKNKSFTLIELLVVIVIIGILAGVIMISTSSSIDKANIAKSKVFEESVANDLAANMVSRWKLDEGTGVTANDIWGLNNGSIIGSTWKNDTHCVSGKCLSFNGTISDYIDCGSDDSLNIRDKITVSMWVNPRTLPTLDSNQQTLYTRGNVYSFLILNYVNGKIYVLQSSGSGWINLAITSSQFLYINKWTHIAASYDSGSGEIKIFANGLNVKTSGNTPSQITSSIPTVIGARNWRILFF
ncbi:MAG: LamG-like jellyroll fold domain-containing protein [Bacilli bacterium]